MEEFRRLLANAHALDLDVATVSCPKQPKLEVIIRSPFDWDRGARFGPSLFLLEFAIVHDLQEDFVLLYAMYRDTKQELGSGCNLDSLVLLACSYRRVELLMFLHHNGVKLDTTVRVPCGLGIACRYYCPFYQAIVTGDPLVVNLLDGDYAPEFIKGALILELNGSGSDEIVKTLLHKVTDMSIFDFKLLVRAVFTDCEYNPYLEHFLSKRVDFSVTHKKTGNNLLHHAISEFPSSEFFHNLETVVDRFPQMVYHANKKGLTPIRMVQEALDKSSEIQMSRFEKMAMTRGLKRLQGMIEGWRERVDAEGGARVARLLLAM